jgi:hypothetical protein
MAVDKKISQLASGAPAQAGDEYVVARSGANYKLTLTNIAASMPATTITTGNLTFSSTAQRITGDMNNATVANRVMFQNSVTNGNTNVAAIPNGTATVGVFRGYGASDPTNATALSMAQIGTTDSRISAEINGTASYTPMTFYTGGSERVRIDTSGNVGIGTASPNFKEEVSQGSGSPAPSLRQTPQLVLKGWGGAGTYHSGICFSMSEHTAGYWGSGIIEIDDSGNYGAALGFYTSTGAASAVPTEKMRISSPGNVGIGGTAGASTKLDIVGALPSNGFSRGVRVGATIPSATTGNSHSFLSQVGTEAASFTIGDINHFLAAQGTFGAGSTVTNQYGFHALDNLTGATNNYGFYSNIASGSNRWNFYAAGTAQNYFAGNTGVGVSPTYRLQVDNSSASVGTDAFVVQNSGVSSVGHTAGMRFRYIGAEPAAIRAILTNTANGEGTLSFYTSSDGTGANLTERMRINSSGQVGINKDPSARLNVSSDSGTIAYFQNSSGTGVYINAGDNTWTSASDERVKTNLVEIKNALEKVLSVRAVTGRYKTDSEETSRSFLIAQDFQSAFPQAVSTANPEELGLRYTDVVPLLVAAIKELTARVAELEAK